MAVPSLFSNTRTKGHQIKLAQSRLEQRKRSFTHWVKLEILAAKDSVYKGSIWAQ